MDKVLLLDAVRNLDELGTDYTRSFALPQAVKQFHVLLQEAKTLYPSRPDIMVIDGFYGVIGNPDRREFLDAVKRLRTALELSPPGAIAEQVSAIQLPPDANSDLASDLQEFKEAVALGLLKSALLLAGSLAEALLLLRHPDKSDRGPGLKKLVEEADNRRLFGRDMIRQLESLIDYRDLIHTRAGPRNKINLSEARVEHAVMALKLLCSELQDRNLHY